MPWPWQWCKKLCADDHSPDSKSFFVITTIFNPASFKSRYTLYHNFAEHMRKTGAQLITIECIFPSLNQTKFQVTNPDNPFHIQLKSKSVYWMKENLINIAVSRLPPHAKWVSWLDADIHFHQPDWVELTIQQLKKYSVVQVFKKAKFLGPPPDSEILRTDYSFGYSVVHGKIIDQNRYDEWYPHPGYGWAMSLDAFRLILGLPDYDIMGSGDLHFAFSLINKVSNAIEKNLSPQFKNMILDHSETTFRKLVQLSSSESKSIVGYVPVTISHNWHGSRKDRQYVDRWKVLIAHNFNYFEDIRSDDNGLLELNPNKPFLQKDILAHFHMRKEDAKKTNVKEDLKDTKKRVSDDSYKRRRRNDRRRRERRNSLADNGVDFVGGDGQYYGGSDGGGDSGDCSDGNGNEPCPEDNYDNYGGGYADNYDGTVECTSQY